VVVVVVVVVFVFMLAVLAPPHRIQVIREVGQQVGPLWVSLVDLHTQRALCSWAEEAAGACLFLAQQGRVLVWKKRCVRNPHSLV
jgi:hypothetical protein